MAALDAWVLDLCAAVGVDPAVVDRDVVLALAGRAAHAVVRPAAPVTTFVAGCVVGAAVAAGEDPIDTLERVARSIGEALPDDR
jgi:uncharacterized protein (DUF697 family)